MRNLHFVGDEQPLAAQRPGLPEQRDLAQDCGIQHVTLWRLFLAFVLHQQQFGDAGLVVDDALAPDLSGMGGQHRRDQRLFEQIQDRLPVDALAGQQLDRLDHRGPFFRRDPLTILGQIGEQRK